MKFSRAVICRMGIGRISHLDLGASLRIGGVLTPGIGGISSPRIELRLFTLCKKDLAWPVSGGAGSVGGA